MDHQRKEHLREVILKAMGHRSVGYYNRRSLADRIVEALEVDELRASIARGDV